MRLSLLDITCVATDKIKRPPPTPTKPFWICSHSRVANCFIAKPMTSMAAARSKRPPAMVLRPSIPPPSSKSFITPIIPARAAIVIPIAIPADWSRLGSTSERILNAIATARMAMPMLLRRSGSKASCMALKASVTLSRASVSLPLRPSSVSKNASLKLAPALKKLPICFAIMISDALLKSDMIRFGSIPARDVLNHSTKPVTASRALVPKSAASPPAFVNIALILL